MPYHLTIRVMDRRAYLKMLTHLSTIFRPATKAGPAENVLPWPKFGLNDFIIVLLIMSTFFSLSPGEVERLLREYRQNQELVRNIGAHYYQIIYPVQLRHHEKMGISTREVNTPKVRIECRTCMLQYVFTTGLSINSIMYSLDSPFLQYHIQPTAHIRLLKFVKFLH